MNLGTNVKHAPLRMSKPDFWNKAAPSFESECNAAWSGGESRLFSPDNSTAKGVFTLQDGPPYANGSAHLGHVLNKCLKDAYARKAESSGFSLQWRAGWDCHGLPLELAAEKSLGSRGASSPAFLAECSRLADFWSDDQKGTFSSLGLAVDFDNSWKTKDPLYEGRTMDLLVRLWRGGLLSESHAPVRWCPACKSSLAQSELAPGRGSRLEMGALAEFDKDSAALLARKFGVDLPLGVFLGFWTTTPWTLPSNAAFAVPVCGSGCLATLPGGMAVVLSVDALRLLPAGAVSLGSFDWSDWNSMFPDGLFVKRPLNSRCSRVFSHGLALSETGLGAVHLAPAYGPEDYEASLELGFSWDGHVGVDGRFSSGPWVGSSLSDGSANCVSAMKDAGLLLFVNEVEVETQCCWRHGVPTYWMSARQWVLELERGFGGCPEGLAARAMKMLDKMDFHGDSRTKDSLLRMLSGRSRWNLSRRRFWGVPFPFFRSVNTGELHPDSDAQVDLAVEGVSRHGVGFWSSVSVPEGYERETQVLDVWFDSGASLFCSTGELGATADLGLEGRDQTRGWFLSSLLLGAFDSDVPPFKRLLAHGFVVDEHGRKLSKSKGNVPKMKELFKFGAEPLRLWSLSRNPKEDAVWSSAGLLREVAEQTAWRSFLRFLLSNMGSFNDKPGKLRPLDHAALSLLAETEVRWREAFDDGRPDLALMAMREARQWFSRDLFELSKRRLYCAEDGNLQLLGACRALRAVFAKMLMMLDPFMPFSTRQAFLVSGANRFDVQGAALSSLVFDWDLVAKAKSALTLRHGALFGLEQLRGDGGTGVLSVMVDAPLWSDNALSGLFPGVCVGKAAEGSPFEFSRRSSDSVVKCPRCWRLAFSASDNDGLCDECSFGFVDGGLC